ncbi:hypothetical protein INT46_007082 [Mucor plumbeus]|uniref:PH domain-containing protein n=1 Tax=Mucor plumbeus TaxID=97098 RepID=A0A8H7VEL4_9FUNG|nr:hypothetical protein INT46_007082 [Mucor plumbeus]
MMKNDLKLYKDSRKQFEKTLDKYETQLNRYNVLSKQKEASALREDAFQMYELRKLYIRNSSDHFAKLVSFKANLEIMLIECFSGALSSQIEEIDESAYTCSSARSKLAGWKQWLDESKITTKYQLNKIKKRCTELQELYINQIKPHRSLKCYSTVANDQMLAVSPNSLESEEEVSSSTATTTQELNPSSIGVKKASKGDRIRISECIFRVCTDIDRRYCFEVTHPKCNFFLQAETEEEMQQWLWSIEYNMQEHEAKSLSTSPQLLLSPKALVTDQFHTAVAENSPRLVAISTSPLLIPDGSREKGLTPMLSTTASSLTELMIREGDTLNSQKVNAIDIKQAQNQDVTSGSTSSSSTVSHQFSSWNMPWLTTGINAFSNLEEDQQQALADSNDPTQLIVWPNKLETDVPIPQISHYSGYLEIAQRELRKFFSNVPKDEIVVETSLYHKLTTEDNQDDVHNKPITYGYSGTAYITQRNLWFYSCTLMTCVNMIVIPLQKISSISIENTAHSNGMLMLIETNVPQQKQTIRFGLWLENADVVSEKLKHAVSNAISHDENDQQLYDTIKSITSSKLHKNKTPTSHVTTSSASYALVTPLTVQAQPVMMQSDASSSTNNTIDDAADDGNCSNHDNSTTQQQKLSDEETSQTTPPSAHRGSPAQGALAAVAARNQKNNSSALKSGTPSRASTPRMQSNDDWPSHIQKPDGKVDCDCTEHLDKIESDLVLPANAKQVFDLMFKQSDIWSKLNKSKNYGPPTVSEWQDNKRTLQYTMPVSNPMVKAKETDVIETQEIIHQKEYMRYIVAVTTKTPNLPYADAFIPTIKYCITYETASSCRLMCSVGVRWLRSIFVKSVVNRAATKGMQETIAGILPIIKQEFTATITIITTIVKSFKTISIYQHTSPKEARIAYQYITEKEIALGQVNETIYGNFQSTRQGITEYNYRWISKQHRLMAAELGYSRERLGALRYELLSTFRILNRVEYQLLETEYLNWVSDKQLDCKDDYYLEGSVKCMDSINQSPYDFATENDIKTAQFEIARELKPEIKSSLIEAISVLNSFDLAEHEITVKLQVQERLKSELQRQRIRGPLSDRLEQLRNKKNRLIQLNRLEDQNIAEETERLTALKKQNLLTEKKMESTSVLSNESASSKEKRRMELIQELENLKKSKEVREQLYEDMRQQTIEHTKPIETTDQKETKLISTIESISLYTNHLELPRYLK